MGCLYLYLYLTKKQVCVQPTVNSAVDICCCAPLLLDVRRPPPSTDMSLPAGRPAANPLHAAVAVERWDRQTDGPTPDRYADPAPHTMPRGVKTHATLYISLTCIAFVGRPEEKCRSPSLAQVFTRCRSL